MSNTEEHTGDDAGPCMHIYNGEYCELCGAEFPFSVDGINKIKASLIRNGWRVVDSRVIEDRDPGDEDEPPNRWFSSVKVIRR